MAVITTWRTGPTTLLTAGTWRFGGREDGRRVGWVSRRHVFRLAAELAFAQAKSGAQEFRLRPGVHSYGCSALMMLFQ